MKYKEFCEWANERACDGQWGLSHALESIDIIEEIRKQPIFKRRKYWRLNFEERAEGIVKDVNRIKNELEGVGNES